MTIIGLTSAHGAPGVTTLAVALAHHLPAITGRSSLLLEADADGGTLAVRHGLGSAAGMTALAGAARSGIGAADIARYTVEMSSGVPAIVGHPAAEQAHAALRVAAANLSRAIVELDEAGEHDIVVDLGRLRPGMPSQPLAAVCQVLLLVAHPVAEQLVAVADRLESFRALAPTRIVLIGDRPYGVAEVGRVLQTDAIHVVADDAAAVLADPAAASVRRRAAWPRSVAELAAAIARAGEPVDESVGESGGEPVDESVAEDREVVA
jgi:hypothetical protein